MRFAIFAFTCCVATLLSAQQVVFSVTNQFDNEGSNLVNSDSSLFVLLNNQNQYTGPYKWARILKMTSGGVVTKSVSMLGADSVYSYATTLELRNDSLFSVVRKAFGSDSSHQYFQIYDLDLNLLKEQKITGFTNLKSDFVFNIFLEGNFISFVGYTDDFSVSWPIGFVEQRKLSQLNSIYRSYQNSGNLFSSINEVAENRFLVTDLGSKRYYLDSSFTAIDSFKAISTEAWIQQGSYNLGNKTIVFGSKFYPRIDVLNSDTIANRIDSLPQSLPPGYNNPENRAGPYSFDCFDSTFCYFGTTHNWSKPYLENAPMWITIYRLNLDGILAWYKHFGGDANYQLFALTTASDSGLYFIANRYDWTTQNNERDMFVYKIDKNGSMLSTPEHGSLQAIEAVVYPNPFTNQIEVKFLNEELRRANVVLTDISGRTVLRQNLEMSLTKEHTLNTQHLPAGVYVLTLADAQGNVLQRQKVVKQ